MAIGFDELLEQTAPRVRWGWLRFAAWLVA